VWDDLRSQSTATFKVLLVNEEHVILFDVESKAKEKCCKKGHDGHGNAEQQTQEAKSARVTCVVAQVKEPVVFEWTHLEGTQVVFESFNDEVRQVKQLNAIR